MYGRLSKLETTLPLIFAVIALLTSLVANNYYLYIGCVLMVYVVLAIGLDVIMGWAGQFAFSHIAFYGIGAYTTAVLQQRFGIPFPLGLLIALLGTTVIAWGVALASIRLRNIYLGLATVAFASAMHWLAQNWKSVTGGVDGIRLQPSDFILFTSHSDAGNFRVLTVILTLVLFATLYLRHSRLGREMTAIRDSEHVAAVSGVNVGQTKAWAFVISSWYACIGGGMLVVFNAFIDPDNFTFAPAVLLLTMLVVGGMGTVVGVVIGAIVLGILPEILRSTMGDLIVWQEFVYGSILVASITLMPQGIYGLAQKLLAKSRSAT